MIQILVKKADGWKCFCNFQLRFSVCAVVEKNSYASVEEVVSSCSSK